LKRYLTQARAEGRRVTSADIVLTTVCPLCGGVVRSNGYTHRRLREVSERLKAEQGAGR
jgi:hypothetical protein